MSAHHDDVLEDVFLRRRTGIQAQRELDSGVTGGGMILRFPVAVKLSLSDPEHGRLYPLIGLSHEPGSLVPAEPTKVTYRIESPTVGMSFKLDGWFYVLPEDSPSSAGAGASADVPPAGYSVTGHLPEVCRDLLPRNVAAAVHSKPAVRRRLRQLVRDGAAAWETDFFRAVKPMLFSIVGETMRNRHPLKIESSDEWGRAMETAVKGGLMFSSPERTSVNWTNWANRNIRRDVVREQDKRSGRSHADQSIRRFAVAKMPTATDSELHEAAADLYVAWTFENAYRKAKKATPELTLDEFKARNVEPSKTISLDRFRRALEPVPTTAPLSEIGELADQPVVDHVRDADALVDTLTEVRTQLGGSLVDGDSLRLWLVRRGVVEARTNQEWEDARRLDLTHIEAQVFEPWQGADLRWQRRKDRSDILALARTSLDDLAITG